MYDAHVGVTVYYDGLGSTRSLTDINGSVTDTYLYNAYGNLIDQTGNTLNNYLFTGEQYDSSQGNYYLRSRYYDPDTGSFPQMDTYQGRMNEPATLHKYIYANGDPVNGIDPSGFTNIYENMKVAEGVAILALISAYGSYQFALTQSQIEGFNGNRADGYWSENSKAKKLSDKKISKQDQVSSPPGPEGDPDGDDNDYEASETSPKNLNSTQTKNEMSGSQIQRIKKDMKKNGYDPKKYEPIDVRRIPNSGRFEIIDGHHRAQAAKLAGIRKVPIRVWK